ncbi:MAG TPA: hypothetical protein VK557_20645 [Pyrinomonadaceae bacterium]|nr:hypothetical protein [Pyrinomonadaceae bacterium]
MKRFWLGFFFGVVLTVEGIALAGVGHGSYAPLAFASTVFAFFPPAALVAGSLLWALYFLVVPSLDRAWQRITAVLLVIGIHATPSFWVALEDPAFARISLQALLIFCVTSLASVGMAMFMTVRKQ